MMKASPISFECVFAQLEALGSENTRKIYARYGAGDNQFGVTLIARGKIRYMRHAMHSSLVLWRRRVGSLPAEDDAVHREAPGPGEQEQDSDAEIDEGRFVGA